MVYASYKSMFAVMAALTIPSADAVGVCYAPWHHPVVTEELLTADMKLISQSFTSFRTFEVRMNNLNVIDVAAAAGVKIAVGVQMNDLANVDAEIQAVCEGYNRHPGIVDTVWVGNENLQNNGFGTVSVDQLVGYINQVKACTNGGVPVGTVQRINEWLSAPGVDRVAQVCARLGVNIYPFFTQGEMAPIEKLEAQWQQMLSKYDAIKLQLMETGWPTAGNDKFGNTPLTETLQLFLNAFATWVTGVKNEAYWFMMFDSTISYTGDESEKHFGVYRIDSTPKVQIPDVFKTITPITGSQTNGTSGRVDQTEAGQPDDATTAPTTDGVEQAVGTSPPMVGEPVVRNPDGTTTAPTTDGVEQAVGTSPPMVGEPLVRNPDGTPASPTSAPTSPVAMVGEPVVPNSDGTTTAPTTDGVEQAVGTSPPMVGEPVVRNPDGTPASPTPAPASPVAMVGEPVVRNPDGTPMTSVPDLSSGDKSKKDCPM